VSERFMRKELIVCENCGDKAAVCLAASRAFVRLCNSCAVELGESERFDGSERDGETAEDALPAERCDIDSSNPPDSAPNSASNTLATLYKALRDTMRVSVRGHVDAINRLALTGALHLSGTSCGQCVLVVGDSGVGKSYLLRQFVAAIQKVCTWDGGLSVGVIEAADLNAPGWVGGKSVGGFVSGALARNRLRSGIDERPVLLIDEVHWLAAQEGEVSGNMRAKKDEVFAGLLALTGGGTIMLDDGTPWNAKQSLVILAGAFTRIDWRGETPSAAELTRGGFPWELANRLAGCVLRVHAMDRETITKVLQKWPGLASRLQQAKAIGIEVVIADVTYSALAQGVVRDAHELPLRVAGEMLRLAVEAAMIHSLEGRNAMNAMTVIGPDDVRAWRVIRAEG